MEKNNNNAELTDKLEIDKNTLSGQSAQDVAESDVKPAPAFVQSASPYSPYPPVPPFGYAYAPPYGYPPPVLPQSPPNQGQQPMPPMQYPPVQGQPVPVPYGAAPVQGPQPYPYPAQPYAYAPMQPGKPLKAPRQWRNNFSSFDGTLGILAAEVLVGITSVIMVVLLVILSISSLSANTGVLMEYVYDMMESNPVIYFIMSALPQFCFAAAFFGLALILKVNPIKAGKLNRSPNLVQIPIVILIGIISIFLVIGAALVFDIILQLIGYYGPMDADPSAPITPEMVDWGSYIVFAIVACLMAPVFEELLFRGMLLSALRGKVGDIGAVLISGLMFMLMHQNPSQTVYQFCLGCFCGLIFIKGKSIWGAVALHAVSNMLATGNELVGIFTGVYPIYYIYDLLITNMNVGLFIIVALALTAIGTVLVLLLIKLYGKADKLRLFTKKHVEDDFDKTPAHKYVTDYSVFLGYSEAGQPLFGVKKKRYVAWIVFLSVFAAACAGMWLFTFGTTMLAQAVAV